MALFSGKCRGGPYDGRPLHHGVPTYQIAINNGKPLTHRFTEEMKTRGDVMKIGTYTHQKNEWIWTE